MIYFIKVKKQWFLLMLILFGFNQGYLAQTVITLNQPETGIQVHKAKENVKFQVGYHYAANLTENLRAYIDELAFGTGLTTSGGLDPAIFDGNTINTNLIVGTIKGSHAISPSGAASYSIPIKLPPGRNEMSPALSVNYNSQSGNGVLGMGWHLGGVSVISRVPKTIYIDGLKNSVNLTNNDVFSLDGNRLIVTNGASYGSSGTIYGTENETFNTVISNGIVGSGPEWFQVESKNGLIFEYGNTTDSKNFPNINQNSIISWYLNKVTDQYGNYYMYHYRTENNEILIDKIEYGGNSTTGLAPFNTVQFYYDLRQDKNAFDIADEIVEQNVVLSQIKVENEGDLVRMYSFNYGYDIFTYLTEVIEEGCDGTSLNSTVFKYGDNNNVLTEASMASLIPSDISATGFEFFPSDYNGDGKTDLLGFSFGTANSPVYPYHIERHWLEMELFINTGNDTYIKSGLSIPFPPGFNTIDEVYPKQKGQIGNTTLQNVDFNGDGLSDILFVVGNQIIPYLSTGSSFIQQTPITVNSTSGVITRTFDADGDGKTEIFVAYSTGSQTYEYKLIFNINDNDPKNCIGSYGLVLKKHKVYQTPKPQPVGNYAPIEHWDHNSGFHYYTDNPNYMAALAAWNATWQNGNLPYYWQVTGLYGLKYDFANSFVVDHDGDGKYSLENVYHTLSNGTGRDELFEYNGSCLTSFRQESIFEYSNNTLIKDNLFGDFNGDGKTDRLYTHYLLQSRSWTTRYNSISTYFEFTDNNQLLPPYQLYNNGVPVNVPAVHYVADVNGDGKSDIIEFESPTIVNVHYSNGLSFVKKSYPLTIPIDHDIDQLVFGDFNGDDKMDILIQKLVAGDPLQSVFKVLYFEKEGKERLLHAIKDGFNNTTEFTYDYLTNNAIYTKGNSSNYPVTDVQLPLPVVTSVKTPDGIGGNNITTYKYEEALLDRNGKGFLGFKKTISENNITDIRATSEYDLNHLFYTLTPSKLTTELMSGGQYLSQTYFEYFHVNLGNKRFFSYLKKRGSIDYLMNFYLTETTFSYDSDGNMYQSYTTKGNIETEEVYNTFGAHGSTIPTSIESSSVTITRTGAPAPYQRSAQYIYNTQGSVVEKITDSGDANELTETYTYNTLGNQTSLTLSGLGVNPRTTTNIYDSKGRFVVETKNSLNQSSFATYDSKWGVPLTATGIDGLTSTYVYNGFGTLISETTPDNIETTYDLDWDIGNTTITNSIYKNTITKTGSPTSIKWYDAFGRERQKSIDGFNQKVYQITTYDERGNIKTTTAPFHQSQSLPIIVTTNTYNVHNQIASSQKTGIATATNFVYTYAPNQITTTVTNPDLTTSSKTIDATGKIISATDAGGTLNYSYFASGLQKEIQLGGITVNSMEYDLQGNKTKLIDKNAGTTTYQYNAFGELIRQKDANNNEYIMEYDVLGRIIKKEEISGSQIYDFTYVATGNGINQIKKVVEQDNNISEEYSYDGFGRITQLKETVDGNPYNTDFEYDIYSNISAKIYPSGFRVESTYNQYGYLLKKMKGTDVIWEGLAMNAFGNYTNYSKSNGLLAGSNVYNSYGFLETKTTVGIQDLTVAFDIKNGNLFSRYDGIKGILEEFTYDNLNRLTQTEVNGTVQGAMSYSSNGNIQSKTAAGNYTYDNNKINAVVSASNPLGIISTTLQDITYTPFNSTAVIIEGTNELQLTYGPNEQRKKTELLINGSLATTKYFLGDYEKIVDAATGDITELHYIAGGDGLAGIYKIKNGGAGEMFYTYTDHLGSILTLTDDAGTVVAEQNFDAWGKYRDAQTWATATSSGIPTTYNWLTRGYTGHEHLETFNLINMNGRVYDPTLGRMLSVDNYIQSPLFTQSYNRYSYVFNNPLKYTDNSGEFIDLLAIGIYAAWSYFKGVNDNGGQWNPLDWGSTNSSGQANNFVLGISGNSNGVTSFTSGLTTGGGGSALNFNMGSPLSSIPGINFAEVDKARFEPGYGFASVSLPSPSDQYYENRLKGLEGGWLISAPLTVTTFSTPLGYMAEDGGKIIAENFPKYTYGKNYWYGGKHGRYLGFKQNTVPSVVKRGKFLGKLGKGLKFLGPLAGAYGYYDNYDSYKNGEINKTQLIVEQASNTIGFVPIIGTSWSVGWELGKHIGPSTWYGSNDYKWFE